MNVKPVITIDLKKYLGTAPQKVLLNSDFRVDVCNECTYSYSSNISAVYDSHELNFIQHLEIWIDFYVFRKAEEYDVSSTIVLDIPLNELASSDNRNAEALAKLYAARLQIELSKWCSEIYSYEELSYIEANISKIELEPIPSSGTYKDYPVLAAIDHITSENHKSFFAFFSDISSKILPLNP